MIGLIIYLSIGTAFVVYTALDGSLEQGFKDMEEELFLRGIVVPYGVIVSTLILSILLIWPGSIVIEFNDKSKKD